MPLTQEHKETFIKTMCNLAKNFSIFKLTIKKRTTK